MAIETIYRVSIELLEDDFDELEASDDFERKHIEAIAGEIDNGICKYSNVEIWAHFATMHEAVECERKLLKLLKR